MTAGTLDRAIDAALQRDWERELGSVQFVRQWLAHLMGEAYKQTPSTDSGVYLWMAQLDEIAESLHTGYDRGTWVRLLLREKARRLDVAAAARRAVELCDYHPTFDAAHEPTGPPCRALGVEIIEWTDGRTSVACKDHGVESLTAEARQLVVSTRPVVG